MTPDPTPDELAAALEIVVARTKFERYRWLCSEANTLAAPNDRASWRSWVSGQARSDPVPYVMPPLPPPRPTTAPPPLPGILAQAGNALAAAGRVVAAVATGQAVAVDQAEQERRLAICRSCQWHDNGRCELCGCVASLKARLSTEHCPLPAPKW